MAHHHERSVLILKTPEGYLTETGFTNDICSKEIVVLTLLEAGGYWASKKEKISELLKRSTAKVEYAGQEGFSVLSYNCDECYRRTCTAENDSCKFWTDRANVKFSEFF
jgi:hypothetical protein